MGGNVFSSKDKIRGMLSRLLEYIFQNMLSISCGGVKVFGVVCILKLQGPIHLQVHKKLNHYFCTRIFEPI